MRILAAIVVGLIAAYFCSLLVGFVLAGFIDTAAEPGKSAVQTWQSGVSLVGWVVLGYVFWRAGTARRTWGWGFLTSGLLCLATPLATIVFSAGTFARSTSTAAAAGAGVAGVVATVAIGFVAFFFAAIFLVLAAFLLRGAPQPKAAVA